MRGFALLIGANDRLAGYLAAALPADVTVLVLRGWNEPQTTTRLAQNRRAKQPLVEPDLLLYPHRQFSSPKARCV
jgi:hypothetical protein